MIIKEETNLPVEVGNALQSAGFLLDLVLWKFNNFFPFCHQNL